MEDKKKSHGTDFKKRPKYGKGHNNSPEGNKSPKEGGEMSYNGYRMARTNPWDLYASDRDMLAQLSSVPFTQVAGGLDSANLTRAFPGFAMIDFFPSIGVNPAAVGGVYGQVNPASLAANMLYAGLYNGYTTQTSFESSDLMMYNLAVTHIIVALAEIRRLFRLAKKFDQTNRYLGNALFSAYGVDYHWFMENYQDLKAKYNLTFERVAKLFRIPMDSNILKRWLLLVGNVYTDSLSTRSQFYVMRPRAYWMYDATAVASGSALRWIQSPFITGANISSISQMFVHIDRMINVMDNDTDINNMSGAMYKGWGDSSVIKYDPIVDYEGIDFVYDELMLHQIHNMDVFHPYSSLDSVQERIHGWAVLTPGSGGAGSVVTEGVTTNQVAVWQYDNRIIHGFVQAGANIDLYRVIMVDVHSEHPGPEELMESTRFKAAVKDSYSIISASEATLGFGYLHTGSELVVGFKVFQFAGNGTLVSSGLNNTTISGISDISVVIGPLSAFDWHPLILQGQESSGQYKYTQVSDVFGDIDNYTFIEPEYVASLNDRTFWALLNIPLYEKLFKIK